jgi:hypothetical protein
MTSGLSQLHHARPAASLDYLANQPRLVRLGADEFQNRIRLVRRHNRHHADAHVEDLVKFRIRHAAPGFDDFENRQHVPRTFVDDHVQILRQRAGDIVHKPAAGDVGEGFYRRTGILSYIEFSQQFLHQRSVADVDFQQFRANGAFQSRHAARWLELQLLEENFTRQRIAVRVQAGRSDADDRVAALHGLLAIEHFALFDDADNRAAHVVFAFLVEPRHLGRFAADKRAMVFGASARKALDDFGEDVRLQFAGAEVIEEEQRLGAQHGDVIDAMVHEVGADGVVPVHREGDFELGAHAIHGRHEDRLAVFFQIKREQAAKAADLAEHLAAMRGGEQLRQGGFDPVAQINVHPRPGISLLFHVTESKSVKRRAGEKI